jgi:PurA ssDNA and RNA-binding protein
MMILASGKGAVLLLTNLSMFDPMSELTGDSGMQDMGGGSQPAPSHHHSHGGDRRGGGDRGGNFAQDLHSVTIHARQRTFYIDLKQSGNGKFFKVSEKSRGGQKTTIMFDSEDLDKFIEAFQEMKTKM